MIKHPRRCFNSRELMTATMTFLECATRSAFLAHPKSLIYIVFAISMFRKTVPSVDSPPSPSNTHLSSTHHTDGLVFQIGPFPMSLCIHVESRCSSSSFVCVLIKRKSNVFWLGAFYIADSCVFGWNVASFGEQQGCSQLSAMLLVSADGLG